MNSSIAVVMPTFTSTPYSQYPFSSFYGFYKAHLKDTGNITSNLDWLRTNVSSAAGYNLGWGHDLFLYDFLTSPAAQQCGLFMGKNIKVITDVDVQIGRLFAPNGSSNFNSVIIGHEEYATQPQYDQYRKFVGNGGRLIIVSANNFYAKVSFNVKTGIESFIIGHGIGFNGKTAWHTSFQPYWKNNTNWFGSNYWGGCCRNISGSYVNGATVGSGSSITDGLKAAFGPVVFTRFHEGETNYITNMTDTSIIAVFFTKNNNMTAAYVHDYRHGEVISMGVYSENAIDLDKSMQYFLVLALREGGGKPATTGPVISPQSSSILETAVAIGAAVFAAYVAVNLITSRRRKP